MVKSLHDPFNLEINVANPQTAAESKVWNEWFNNLLGAHCAVYFSKLLFCDESVFIFV